MAYGWRQLRAFNRRLPANLIWGVEGMAVANVRNDVSRTIFSRCSRWICEHNSMGALCRAWSQIAGGDREKAGRPSVGRRDGMVWYGMVSDGRIKYKFNNKEKFLPSYY
jgi:hypothetical protein